MNGPCIKGIAFQAVVDDVRRLVSTGEISQEALASALEPSEIAYLDEPVIPTIWYPIGALARYMDLLWRTEGGSRKEFLVQRGSAAAERIFESGIYAKLMATAEGWGGGQVATALINLSTSFYNFMHWRFVGDFDDDEFAVEVSDAEDYPDELRITTEGFMEYLYSRSSKRDLAVTSERPAPDRVIYRVVRRL